MKPRVRWRLCEMQNGRALYHEQAMREYRLEEIRGIIERKYKVTSYVPARVDADHRQRRKAASHLTYAGFITMASGVVLPMLGFAGLMGLVGASATRIALDWELDRTMARLKQQRYDALVAAATCPECFGAGVVIGDYHGGTGWYSHAHYLCRACHGRGGFDGGAEERLRLVMIGFDDPVVYLCTGYQLGASAL